MEKQSGIVWSASFPFLCSFSPESRPQSAAYQVAKTHIDTCCITGLRKQRTEFGATTGAKSYWGKSLNGGSQMGAPDLGYKLYTKLLLAPRHLWAGRPQATRLKL